MTAKQRVVRIIMMFTGNLVIGICVGCYRLSEFGVDAFTCINLGISKWIGMSFGTWQLIMNVAILVLVFFTMRKCIGIGTIINMAGIGYLADFICWMAMDAAQIELTLTWRIIVLLIGMLVAPAGVACYMAAEMGVAPYDSTTLILEKYTKGKIPFKALRMMTDSVCIITGIIFCMIAKDNVWEIVGIGTIGGAVVGGPLIQFFRIHLAEPMIKRFG